MSTVDETLTTPDLAAIVIDLSAVTFLGSSGLGTLAELATRTPSSRPVRRAAASRCAWSRHRTTVR